MMRSVLLLATIAVLTTTACGVADKVLYAPFDGTSDATGDSGRAYTAMDPFAGPYVQGAVGQARRLGGKNTCTYYIEEGFPPAQGTCMMWASPHDWKPAGNDHFVFFTVFEYPAAENGYIRLILYKIHNETDLTLLIQDTINAKRTSVIKAPIEFWRKREWHHIVFTWDAEKYHLYVDGQPAGEAAAVPLPTEGRWEIRVGTPYAGWAYVGNETNSIDEFTILDRALTPGEIKQMHDEIAPTLPPPPPETAGDGDERENLALRRNGAFVLASSFADYSTNYPDNLIDGDPETVWAPFEHELPQWLEVRWPQPMRCTEVTLRLAEAGSASAMSVFAWETAAGDWRPVAPEAAVAGAGDALTARIPETLTTRLRVSIEQADVARLSVSELEVHGPPQPIIARIKPYWQASYIWYPEEDEVYKPNQPRYFRHLFDVADPALVQSAVLQLRSNDMYRAWLNGVEVASGSKNIQPVDVEKHLVAGRNVLAVVGELHSNPGRWGWGEMLYELAIGHPDQMQYVASGPNTLTSAEAAEGWLGPGFTAEGWRQAAVFVRPPDGVWGEIAYFSKPVAEEVALRGFSIEPEAPVPGTAATVTVELELERPLRDDYAFVLDMGMPTVSPDWNNFDLTSAVLVPAEPTSGWDPAGPHALDFTLELPPWTPDGPTPLRLSAYGMNSGGQLRFTDANRESPDRIGEMVVRRPGMDVEAPAIPRMDASMGAIGLKRGTEMLPPVFWALRANSWDRYQVYGDAGVHIYHVQTHPEKLDDTPETMARVQRYIDERIATVLRVDPHAQFIVMVELRPSAAWLEANAGERLVTAQGTYGPVSYCSAAYFDSVDRFLGGLVGFLRQQPYYGRIVGYLPMSCGSPDSTMGGTEGNLFQKDRSRLTVGDFNPQAIAAFRQWLREKYENAPERLQAAWADPRVTFDTATPEISQLVAEGADGGVFRDPKDSGMTLDYFDFLSGVMGRFYSHVMATMRGLVGDGILLGTYYGYTLGHLRGYNNPGSMFNGNNFDLHRCLQDPNWDFIAGPMPYESRRAGQPFRSYQPTGSVLLHNKLVINEDDHRTFVASPTTYGRLRSPRETEAVLKRDIGGSIIDGTGHWFADWSGPRGRDSVGFFTDPSILKTVRETTNAAALALREPKGLSAEVALIIHGGSMACNDAYRASPLYHNLLTRTVWAEMTRMGVPYDTYLLEDLADERVRDGYKLYVLLNPFLLTDEHAQLIEGLKRDGKTLLFFYAPGYADRESGLGDEHITALTGFPVSHTPPGEIMRYSVTDTESPITAGIKPGTECALEAFGYELSRELHPPAFGPVFRIEGESIQALAAYPDGGTVLAARDMGEWKSVYCTVPYMSSAMLRGVCRYAGVHIYCNEDIILKADNRCLTVHNGYDGERDITINLPAETGAIDWCSGEQVAAGTRALKLHLGEGDTRILGLEQ